MNRTPTMFLRIVVFCMGLAALALCVLVFPVGLRAEWDTGFAPIVIAMYAAAVPFFVALYHTLKLLELIDTSKAFSQKSIAALQHIKYCAAIVAVLFTLGLPYFYNVAQIEDAPGVMVVGLLFAGAPLVIAVFAAVLQELLRSAIAIKNENDLTV